MIEQPIEELKSIVGERWIVYDKEAIESYLFDETPEAVRPKPTSEVLVVKPKSSEEISEILKIANEKNIPVFPVGGKTGLVGGSMPLEPGLILSLERLKAIEVDKDNLMVTAEAGVTLGDLIKAVEDSDLYFPIHPGDEGAFVGGLIATNAGGARAVKYGVTRNYVKGIEVVLPTGEIISLGGKLLKNNTGYNLMHLIIGSEGTLGIITKGIMKLYPKTKYSATLVAPFSTRQDAIFTVLKILRSLTPLAVEYVEQEDILKAADHLNERWPVERGFAQLIIILNDISEDAIYVKAEKIEEICKENNSSDLVIADTREEQERILKIRSHLYTPLKPEVCDILDIVVPQSKLGELMNIINEIGAKHNTRLPVYGHPGDGNLHVHIMKIDGKVPGFFESVKNEIYEVSVQLGGKITGEHGIGRTKVKDLKLSVSEKEIELMKAVKKVFDPNGILNPGKVIEDA